MGCIGGVCCAIGGLVVVGVVALEVEGEEVSIGLLLASMRW